ncbi:type IV secretory system conjugative DNA transfer family protein [Streptomyces sp. 15-116A]|uniref:type IV secretory system conjugative DNA transfer family protein n=1 Tax=Streptomyces sp. 15-116A TaxID=2259035 RepID=UPI0021B37A3C|nr:type IV secretory system conjugative DNA transfer family protein [Streptomyces sp. 15-116A]MCT7353733.1 type IV secretory system conjugative DNA transfer family protein [Streptomyces sp. 15-116A]
MRPEDHRARDGQGGIPDGLLIGILAFLLGMTVLVWTATGLAGLFTHGSWPAGVTFARTPLAMRHLVAEPHDIPGAWPGTPSTDLSGYGLFWGLFIGQLMILLVLTVFVLGTVARWRAGRARRRAERAAAQERAATALPEPHPSPAHHEVPTPRPAPEPEPAPAQETAPQEASPGLLSNGERAGGWETHRAEGTVHYGPPATRHTTATQAVRDAEGPALVLTSSPALWQDTKDARAKLGPTHLYDPTHLCDTPSRLHWSPTTGCEDKDTAVARAEALLTPVRPTSRLDQALTDTAQTLLRSYLHAAAIDGRTIRHVHRWSQGTQIQDAVRILRTNPKAAPGAAGELEAALTAHPERRDMAQQLTTRALSALSTVNVREACTPNRSDALALDSFIHEGGTLYVVGESIEDPRTTPGAMPLLTALTASVVEHGRRMAARSSSGRLDPPLTLVLDDVAAVAPLPQLPELLTTGADQGLPTLALLRSREQGRARWPHDELPV